MLIRKKQNAPASCIKPDPTQSLSDIIVLIKEFAATQECFDVSLTLHWDSGHPKAKESATPQQPLRRTSEGPAKELSV
jgi:hypothetical protein